jgi:hypothetical protein
MSTTLRKQEKRNKSQSERLRLKELYAVSLVRLRLADADQKVIAYFEHRSPATRKYLERKLRTAVQLIEQGKHAEVAQLCGLSLLYTR